MFSRFYFMGRLGMFWTIALLLVLLFTPAFGQFGLLSQKNGTALDDRLGSSLAGAGDVNGDGVPDYIIGVPYADPSALTNAGTALVYSGTSGLLLYQKNGTTAGDRFGTSVAGAGDLNGDGRADFIIASLSQSFVYSGATGNLLYQKSGGSAVAGAGDVDGDGKADFIVGVRTASPGGLSSAGSVFVYSGATGNLIYQINGTSAGDNLGNAVAGLGDINGDGRADFIAGAQGADPGGIFNAGSAFVYSGATGAVLYQKNGSVSLDLFGNAVAGAGDVNGDGKPDFLVGAYLATINGMSSAGAVYLYSGATGALLLQKSGPSSAYGLGLSVAGVGDADGDGKADILVGSDANSAFLYSGTTGALLFQINGSTGDNLGDAVAGVGDVNGNHLSDFLVGAPFADPAGQYDAGSAYLYGSGSSNGSPCKVDTTPPTITCSANKQIACGAKVVFDQPTAVDNCDATPLINIVSTTQKPGPGLGETTYTRTWITMDDSGNVSIPCSQNIVVSACAKSQITPSTTTCSNFNSGLSADLTSICYSTRNGKISKTSPSAFYYYTALLAPSVSFTVDIVQTSSDPTYPFFGVARNGITLYDGNCTAIGSGISNSSGQAQVSVSGATIGQLYIISVKYTGSSLNGILTYSSEPVLYNFSAKINGVEVARDRDGITLTKCPATVKSNNGNALDTSPAEVELSGNYPNPFNATTSIRFSLSQDALVRLDIYNILGQKVRTLLDETRSAGEHTVVWDGKNGAGEVVASGVYYYMITIENQSKVVGSMTLLK